MTQSATQQGKGLLASLATLTATLVAIAYTLLDLLSNELDEEKAHFLALMVLMLVMLFSLGIGVLLATIFLVLAFWDNYRLPLLAAMAVIYLGAGLVAWLVASRKMKKKHGLLATVLPNCRKITPSLIPVCERQPRGHSGTTTFSDY